MDHKLYIEKVYRVDLENTMDMCMFSIADIFLS